jgi:3-deoxy-D-manno-octulosonic-acid transferase
VESFVEAGAIVQLPPLADSDAATALADTFSTLLDDPSKRLELGTRARSLVNENRGATERTLLALNSLLASPAKTPKSAGPLPANTPAA